MTLRDLVERVAVRPWLAAERPLGMVLDLRLPDGRGDAVLVVARAMRSAVPVAVVTIDDDDGRTRALGADDHLTKPIDNARLSAWLAQIAARASAAPEPSA